MDTFSLPDHCRQVSTLAVPHGDVECEVVIRFAGQKAIGVLHDEAVSEALQELDLGRGSRKEGYATGQRMNVPEAMPENRNPRTPAAGEAIKSGEAEARTHFLQGSSPLLPGESADVDVLEHIQPLPLLVADELHDSEIASSDDFDALVRIHGWLCRGVQSSIEEIGWSGRGGREHFCRNRREVLENFKAMILWKSSEEEEMKESCWWD